MEQNQELMESIIMGHDSQLHQGDLRLNIVEEKLYYGSICKQNCSKYNRMLYKLRRHKSNSET